MFTVYHFKKVPVRLRSGKLVEIVQRQPVVATPSMTTACAALDSLGGVLCDERTVYASDLDDEHLKRALIWTRSQERFYGRLCQGVTWPTK